MIKEKKCQPTFLIGGENYQTNHAAITGEICGLPARRRSLRNRGQTIPYHTALYGADRARKNGGGARPSPRRSGDGAMNVRKKLPRAIENFGKLCDTVRKKYEPRFLRHLLSALPFIVFAILGYCCILFAANHPKISPQKVQSNQKRQDGRLRRGEDRRACWAHRQELQQSMSVSVSAFDRARIAPLQYIEPTLTEWL